MDGGKVKLNGAAAKPAKDIKTGDRLHIRAGEQDWEVIVLGENEQRRLASEAQLLYQETPESPCTRRTEVASCANWHRCRSRNKRPPDQTRPPAIGDGFAKARAARFGGKRANNELKEQQARHNREMQDMAEKEKDLREAMLAAQRVIEEMKASAQKSQPDHRRGRS